MKISEIKPNPNNPRIIKDEKFRKLVTSIREFPKMMELRPIVVDSDMTVLGGNMRLKAIQELKMKDIPDSWVKRADELTDDEKKRFIIADNVGFGDWDWEMLANEWDADELADWGLDIEKQIENSYEDESNNFDLEPAKELDFFDKFIIVRFKDENQYDKFITEKNIKQVQTSSMTGGKDIRTDFKKVFDYEDLYSVEQPAK